MRNTKIISRAIATLTLGTALVACEDTQTTPKPTTTITPPSSVITPEPPKPPSLPPAPVPEATAPAVQPKGKPAESTVAETDIDDESPSAALAASREALAAGNKERALKLATIAIEHSPKRSSAWNALGRAQLQMGKRKNAITSFEKA